MSRIDALKEMLADDPKDPDLHLMLAAELRQAGRYAEGADALQNYLALMPPSADLGSAYRDLGICLERLGQADAARETYRRGIEAAAAHRHAGLQSEIEDLLHNLPRQ
jgi:Flp pilus assembly protein TadD